MAFGEIYKYTWWGKIVTNGFGFIYQSYLSAIGGLLSVLSGRSDEYENEAGTEAILTPLEDSGLLDKASIILTPTAYSTNSINVVKPEYQVLPTELVTNGTFDTDTNWTRETGWIIGSGVASASSISGARIYQNILTVGKKYRATFELKSYSSGYVRVIIGGYSYAYQTTTISEHTVDFTAVDIQFGFLGGAGFTGSIDNVSVKEIQEADFDFVRATTATRVNENGLIEEVAAGIPRIDYSSGVGQWLFEPLRTNYIRYTEDFSQGYWTKSSNHIYTVNQEIAPDGQTTADKLECNSNSNNYTFSSSNPAGTYSASCFVKNNVDAGWIALSIWKGSGLEGVRLFFNLTTGDLGLVNVYAATGWSLIDYKVEDYGDGWWRLSVSGISTTSTWFRLSFVDDESTVEPTYTNVSGRSMFVWGAQFEAGSYPTSYIPNDGATATKTRNADVANNSGNADLFNDSEGVLYAEIAALANDGTDRYISISDSTTSNRVSIRFLTSTNSFATSIRAGGSSVVLLTHTASNLLDLNKIAVKYKSGDIAIWLNGIEVVTDATTFSASSFNELAFDDGASGDDFYGKTKALIYFPEALTDEELEILTT